MLLIFLFPSPAEREKSHNHIYRCISNYIFNNFANVYKRKHIQSIAFRLLLTAVFGVFFFVQVQSSFIYCAYGNDYAQVSSPNIHNNHEPSFLKAGKHANGHKASFKLNKRYQAVAPHAILPAAVIIPVHFIAVRSNWLIPPVLASTHFLYIKPFRGPPYV